MEINIHIYVSCKKSFKNGINHGVWIDTTLDVVEIHRIIQNMLASSLYAGDTDWWITAFDTPVPYDFLSDQTSLEDLNRMAMLIEYHGDMAAKLLARFGGDVIETEDAIRERYRGHFKNEAEFIQYQLIEEGYILEPAKLEPIKSAINDDMIWRLWRNRFFSLSAREGGVYIFKV